MVRSQEYWKRRNRAEKAFLESYEATQSTFITGQYRQLLAIYKAHLSSFFGKYGIRDGNKIIVSYDDAIKNLTKRETESFQNKIKKIDIVNSDTALKMQAGRLARRKYISRIEKLNFDMDLNLSSKKNIEQLSLTDMLTTSGNEAYYLSIYELEKGLQESLRFGKLSSLRVRAALTFPWSGDEFSNRIWKNKNNMTGNVREILARGFVEGKTYSTMANDLAKRTNTEVNRAKTLIRTESQRINEWANFQSYEEVGLKKYEFDAVNDQRTRPDHAALDGKVFLLEKAIVGVNFPPLGPNCRCTTLPFFEDANLNISSATWEPKSYNKWKEEKNIVIPQMDLSFN